MSSRTLLAILGLEEKRVVVEDDVVMRETDEEDDGGAKAVAPAANAARVRAAESFMLILKWLQYGVKM